MHVCWDFDASNAWTWMVNVFDKHHSGQVFVFLEYSISVHLIKGELHPKSKCFVPYLKMINTFLKNNKITLKQIVWQTQKLN